MAVWVKNFFVATSKEIDCIEIVYDIRAALAEAKFTDGLVTITIPASEACLVVAPAKLEPKPKEKTNVVSLTLPFQNRELLLEPSQSIFLIDFSQSGKRRQFFVQVMGEAPPAPAAAGERRPKR